MNLVFWRSESLEEARQRRLCRKMLMLAPEPEYDHVCSGLATLGALSLLLTVVAGPTASAVRELGPSSLTRTRRPVTELAATGGYARLC